jgi:hypothetical protein
MIAGRRVLCLAKKSWSDIGLSTQTPVHHPEGQMQTRSLRFPVRPKLSVIGASGLMSATELSCDQQGKRFEANRWKGWVREDRALDRYANRVFDTKYGGSTIREVP